MKKLLLFALVLFGLTSYSQELYKTLKVNDIISDGYVSETISKENSTTILIKISEQTLKFENVVPGDGFDDEYSLYSNDDNFKINFYKHKVIVYTKSDDKRNWISLYNIELKDEVKSEWFDNKI